jgi:hypothetical protein
MAQQPNVEITEGEQPRRLLEPGPAVRWRSDKPGIAEAPSSIGGGGFYGTTGPDPGWGLRLLAQTELPSDDDRLHAVVAGLTLARAAALGRAPIPEDIEVALLLLGYGIPVSEDVMERRERWLQASPHETRPGATAVAEVDRALLVLKPEELTARLRNRV